jgi:hypothetical protein
LAKLRAKNKNPVTAPKLSLHFGETWSKKQKPSQSFKLIPHFGEIWSQKQKPDHSPKTDSAFWQNLEPRIKTWSQPQN